ncbi:MAG: hypothetical protein LBP61_04955 [Desulfovibrio sp.]|jgi:hypothetical protein|nr:hypothetical protein [Desulfovibrio sp.]
MSDNNTRKTPLDPKLAALSREEVLSALEREEEAVFAAVSRYIVRYAGLVGGELKAGRDYLPLLAPRLDVPPLEAVAMEIVLETVEEELAEEDEA